MAEGREAQQGGYSCILMADSHCCMAEANTTCCKAIIFRFSFKRNLKAPLNKDDFSGTINK